jgi:hypothetical protein
MTFTSVQIAHILGLSSSDNLALSKEATIASLWAGYGKVTSLKVITPSSTIPLIVKRVKPKNIQDTSVSNMRKMQSYHNEAQFYRTLAPILHSLTNEKKIQCDVAKAYKIEDDDASFTFLLSDLSESFHCRSISGMQQNGQSIEFLAAFHAAFYKYDIPKSMWRDGGYWHLKTRWDEWECISEPIFKNSAKAIDEVMRQDTDFHTLVHGDFKEANILFGDSVCAVVDFQYAGLGYGAKDLVMWIVSSLDSRTLDQLGEEKILRMYATSLKRNLITIGRLSCDEIEKITCIDNITKQYELAIVDYVRFMCGWGFWGSNSDYAWNRAKEILRDTASCWTSFRDGMDVEGLSEQDWTFAIYERYKNE